MKKAILDKYQKSEFSDKFGKEIPREHWELIFSDKSNKEISNLNASYYSRTKEDLGNSFYIDERKYHKNEFYQNNPQQYKSQNYKGKKSEWRPNNYSKTPQSQNITNENPNKNQINDYINRLEMSNTNHFSFDRSSIKSNNQSIQNIPEINENKDNKKFDSALFDSMNEKSNLTECEDNSIFYQDPQKTILTKQIKKELDEIAINPVDTNNNYNFRLGQNNKYPNSFIEVDIKSIYRINEKLNYPKEDPLWYIYHLVSKSSFGPISSYHLEEVYHKMNIDGMSDVRLIDIFKIKNKGSFAYFKLKDVENPNFLIESVEVSSLIRFVEELNKLKKEESDKANTKLEKIHKESNKENLKQKKQAKQKFVDFEDIFNEPQKKEVISIKSNEDEINNKINRQMDNKNNNLIENVGIKINNEKSVIDEEFENVGNKNSELKQTQGTTIIKKKPGKKMKGKPVELDIKTGFFTLSQQEKEYEPIYICGDSSTKKK